MKINLNNRNLVEIALAKINGKATAHTFNQAWQVQREIDIIEGKLIKYGIPKSSWQGIEVVQGSGHALPKSYKYAAKTNVVVLKRGANAWFITEIRTAYLYPTWKPARRIIVDPNLLDLADQRRRGKMSIESESFDD